MRAGFIGDRLVGIAIIVWATISIVLCCMNGGSRFGHAHQVTNREPNSVIIGNGPPMRPSLAHAKSFENVLAVADDLKIFIEATTILELIIVIAAAYFLFRGQGIGFAACAVFTGGIYYRFEYSAMPLPLAIPVLVYCIVRLVTSFGPRPTWSLNRIAPFWR